MNPPLSPCAITNSNPWSPTLSSSCRSERTVSYLEKSNFSRARRHKKITSIGPGSAARRRRGGLRTSPCTARSLQQVAAAAAAAAGAAAAAQGGAAQSHSGGTSTSCAPDSAACRACPRNAQCEAFKMQKRATRSNPYNFVRNGSIRFQYSNTVQNNVSRTTVRAPNCPTCGAEFYMY